MTFALGTATGKIVLDYDGSAVDKAKSDVKDLGDESGTSLKALSKVSNVAAVGGAAIAGGLGLAINAAANFEQRMSAISAVSGASSKQMDVVRNKALQLGKDTAFSASEAGSAIEELVKAGISIPDVMNGAADATVALAAAGEVSLPEAATIASNAMNQFGLAAKDMPHIADEIAGAANASAIDVKDFGYSLSQVGAVAHLAGMDFQDTATAIALMGNAGIKGSDAGTSLKSMFMRLQPTTKKQFDTMTDLGLITFNNEKAMQALRDNGIKPLGDSHAILNKQLHELAANMSGAKIGSAEEGKEFLKIATQTDALHNGFYKLNGDTKSLAQVSQILQNSMKGMTKEQKQATLQTLFGSDAIRGAAVLADKGAKGFNEMAKSMGKVKAADVAKTRMDNLKGSIEQMKGSMETAAIQLGTLMIPYLKQLVGALTGALNWFIGLSDGTKKFVVIALAAVAGILLIVAAIGKSIVFIAEVSKSLQVLKVAMAETWIAALAPILLWIAAIAVVVAIIVILWKKSETFRKIVLGVWDAIKSAAESVAKWFAGPFLNFFQSAWDGIKTGLSAVAGFFKAVWGGIVTALTAVFNVIKTVVMIYFNIYKTIIMTALNVIKAVWTAVWNTFGPLIKAVFGLIVAIIKLAWTIIKGVFILELRLIKKIVSTAWDFIERITSAVWNVIKKVIRTVMGWISAFLRREWEGIKRISSAVWNAIYAVIKWVWDHILKYVVDALKAVWSKVTDMWNKVKKVTSDVWDAVVAVVKQRVDNLVHNVTAIKDRIVGFFKGAGGWLLDAGKKIIQGLLDGITSMLHKVTDVVNKVTGIVGKFLPGSPVKEGPLKVLNRGYAGKQIVKMLVDGIDTGLRPVNTAASTMGGGILDVVAPHNLVKSLSPATGGGNSNTSNVYNVYNPRPERASQSVTRVLRSKVETEGWGR